MPEESVGNKKNNIEQLRSSRFRLYLVTGLIVLIIISLTGYCVAILRISEIKEVGSGQVFVPLTFTLLFLALGVVFHQLFSRQERYLLALDKAKQRLEEEMTNLKQAEEALQESEGKYRNLFENSIEGIGVSKDNQIIMANRALIQMFGFDSFEDFASTPLLDCVAPEYKDTIREKMDRRQRGELLTEQYEYDIIRKNGEIRTLQISTSEVIIQNERFVQSTFRDITENKQLERQAYNSQKMEAVATLAGGIAHQFNNALVGITGSIELLKMELPVDVNNIKYIRRMQSSANRMVALTSQLLAYAGRGKYQPHKTCMGDFLKDILPILESSINADINVIKDIDDAVYPVDVDLAQMQMVLSSLIYNACEAMGKQGDINISLRNEKIKISPATNQFAIEPGRYVCLAVQDNGKGMEKWVAKRIFEPFFSTKVHGRGLGMAAVYGIIQNHGGGITIDSEPGKGTIVRIYLPAIQAEEEEKEPLEDLQMYKGEGTILIIDDDVHVREIARKQLMLMGYNVLTAKSGEEAVKIAETSEKTIDGALLDIVMPGIGGRQTYALIKKARPSIKVIVCSGFSVNGPVKEILDAGADDFIQKPFAMEVLSKKLKQVL